MSTSSSWQPQCSNFVFITPAIFIIISVLFTAVNRFLPSPDGNIGQIDTDLSILDQVQFWATISACTNKLVLPGTVSALRILLITFEEQDQYTLGHSIRVMKIARSLANAMGLSLQAKREIQSAALLHDIGKIEISSSILQKKGTLTEREMISIRNHPKLSVDILQSYKVFYELHPNILHHHEWYNGQGYPNKIRGEEIPIGARIICVADAMDAMMSVRPYKHAKTVAKVIHELKRLKGIQFDPHVADQAICLLEKTRKRH
jgi:putative nucleotidyltransferase with HDIG domain